MKMKRKKIWLNEKHTRYCIVKLFKTKLLMQQAYEKRSPGDNSHYKCLGAHVAYTMFKVSKAGKKTYNPETGTLFLSLKNCGAGIVCHEIAHAVLWAYRHHKNKKQFPIVIKDMKEEEVILHNLTYAVRQFYNWFFKIKKSFK